MASDSPSAYGDSATTKTGIDSLHFAWFSTTVNLRQFGIALLATASALTGCASEPEPQRFTAPPYDKLTDYVDPYVPVKISDGYRMGVIDLLDVRPDLSEIYYGVGTLGDLCIVVFAKYVGHKEISATVIKRFEDTPPVNEIGLLPLKDIGRYVVQSRQVCTSQRA